MMNLIKLPHIILDQLEVFLSGSGAGPFWPVFVHAERNWKYPTEMNDWNMGQDVSKIFDGVWAPNHPNQYPVTPRWNLDMTIFNRNVSQTSWNSIQDL